MWMVALLSCGFNWSFNGWNPFGLVKKLKLSDKEELLLSNDGVVF